MSPVTSPSCQFCGSSACEWEGQTQLGCTDCGYDRQETAMDALERAREAQRRTDIQMSIDWLDESYVGTCQRCGAYWDVRQYERCPRRIDGVRCDGYIG